MILVTGASGGLGRLIVARLSALGAPVEAGTRSPESYYPAGTGLAGIGRDVPVRRVDFDDPASLDFAGVDTMMLISAGYGEDDVVLARHDAAIAAAVRAGVQHVVYTSIAGAADQITFALAHRYTERRLRHADLHCTILRNGLYAELLGQIAAPRDGVITAPLGDGRLAAIARADLAEIAATIVATPAKHAGHTYELVGDRAIGGADLAGALGAVYRPQSMAVARADLIALGLAPFQVPMQMSTYSSIAAGLLDDTRGDTSRLLGAPLRPTLEVIRDTAATWW